MRYSDGYALVYSISRRSFGQFRIWHESVRSVDQSPEAAGHKRPVWLRLIWTRCDDREEREVSSDDGEALARESGCRLFETSAKEDTGVDEAFRMMI